jgi:transcriptional regulator with XRE-family HTH domain
MRSSTYSKEYETLRTWLKSKREEKGLSLRDVGELVGRHHSVIGKMEQDRRKIDVVEFVEYCKALEIDPAEGIKVIYTALLQPAHTAK